MGNALTPIEQRTIVFYDDELTAVLVDVNGRQVVYVPVRPICEFLGVQWAAQSKRIRRDAVLSTVVASVSVMDTQGQQRREMSCLPLNFLNGWMFGINASRVKPEIKERLTRYQLESYQILADAFLTPSKETAVSPTQANLIQIREMGRAIMEMASEQLRMDQRLDKAAVVVGQHGKRITALEYRLSPRNVITEDQAADIAEKVKAIAMAMTEHNSDKNHFQSIFSELHRRYHVSGYKSIRQDQYQAVLDFLDEWMESNE